MTIETLMAYLVGDRRAILEAAANRWTVWLGLLFVLSAGFAREYDGEDLLHEPWHLLLPLGASLLTSFLLFCLVFAAARRHGLRDAGFLPLYRSFLGLYWLTAPLAWLYAVPVERFLSAAAATGANLGLLALVSCWRVGLMTRVISVLFRGSSVLFRGSGDAAFLLVMLFADTVMLALLFFTPLPVFSIMGGIRLTESESLLQQTAFWVGFVGFLSWPIWFFGTMVVLARRSPLWKLATADVVPSDKVSRPLWTLAAASIGVWVVVLPVTQPEQQLRRQVEQALEDGRIEEAVLLMSAHERSDFPPHWDPPPRIGYGQTTPPVLDIMEAVVETDARPWIRELFLDKFQNELAISFDPWVPWPRKDDDQLHRYLNLLETLPEGPKLVLGSEALNLVLSENGPYSEAIRERIRALRDSSAD